MAATTGYVGAGLPATDHSPVHDRASSRPLGVLPGLPARDAKDAVAPDLDEIIPRRRAWPRSRRGTGLHILAGQLACYMERSSPPQLGRAQPAREGENHLANVNCRTYSDEHLASDCVAGSIRESGPDRRCPGSMLSRRGSGRLLLPDVLRARSALRAGQRLSRRRLGPIPNERGGGVKLGKHEESGAPSRHVASGRGGDAPLAAVARRRESPPRMATAGGGRDAPALAVDVHLAHRLRPPLSALRRRSNAVAEAGLFAAGCSRRGRGRGCGCCRLLPSGVVAGA